jgi:hypothetical protein
VTHALQYSTLESKIDWRQEAMLILLVIVELAAFICFIMVLIKQFQTAGPIHGIIGIIPCGLWTFIWGWMNSAQLNIRNIMLIWTVLLVICMLLTFVFGVRFYPGYPTASPVTP